MVEGAVAVRASWLGGHMTAGDAIMHQVEMRLERQFDATPTATMAQTVDATDAALRAHVQAQDLAAKARLDKAEAAIHRALSALVVGLREHTHFSAGETQLARSHGIDRAHPLTRDSPRSL